jgi:hypothetical protein
MNVQKINVKLFTNAPEPVPLDPFLDVFARWREDRDDPAGWIDLADYAHVAKGPGVMLIGRRGNLSVDLADPGPGLLWANKQDLAGSHEERIREIFVRAIGLMRRLVGELEYPAALEPRTGFWELTVNDLVFPNTDATDRSLQPAVAAVAARLFGPDACTLVRQPDPGRRYGFTLHSDDPPNLDALAGALS